MASTYVYRCFKATWGVFVRLTAEWSAFSPGSEAATPITENLYLLVQVSRWRLTDEEWGFVELGLRLIADSIRDHKPTTQPILVRVRDLEVNWCDYQPEGLACAIVGWAAQEFGFPEPAISVTFDREKNRYVFDFPSVNAPVETARP
jgi:hypothetical protein